MSGIKSPKDYKISILLERRPDGTYSIAFCPICDQAAESRDEGKGKDEAVTVSISKIRQHMRLRHRIQDGGSTKDRLVVRG